MKELTITNDNFEELVLKANKPVLVDFWAAWCGPCQMMGPVISKLAEDHDEYIVGKVNVDQQRDLAMKYNIMSIPTLLIFKDGELKDQIIGYTDQTVLESKMENYL